MKLAACYPGERILAHTLIAMAFALLVALSIGVAPAWATQGDAVDNGASGHAAVQPGEGEGEPPQAAAPSTPSEPAASDEASGDAQSDQPGETPDVPVAANDTPASSPDAAATAGTESPEPDSDAVAAQPVETSMPDAECADDASNAPAPSEPEAPAASEEAPASAAGPAAEAAAESTSVTAAASPAPAQPAAKAVSPATAKAANTTNTAADTATTSANTAAVKPAKKAAPRAVQAAAPVADGVYWIATLKDPKLAVGISVHRMNAGAKAELIGKARMQAWQKWQLTWCGSYYVLTNVQSGKVLAVSSKKSGAAVVQQKASGAREQRWSITKSANGKYCTIKNLLSGKILNISGDFATGTRLNALKPNGKVAQRFKLCKAKALDNGTYALSVVLDAHTAVYAPSAKAGTKVVIEDRTGEIDQRFYLRNESGGRYSLQSVSTGLFLADQGGKAVLSPWSSANAALLWNGTHGYGFKLVNASTGKALAVKGGKTAVNTPLVTTTPSNTTNSQRWLFSADVLLEEGAYVITSTGGGNLEVKRGAFKEKTNVRVANQSSVAGAQCFILQEDGGIYRILNARTYQAVAVAGSSKANGANVVQCVIAKNKDQLWRAVINRDGSFSFVNQKSHQLLNRGVKSTNVTQRTASSGGVQTWKLTSTERYSISGDHTLDRYVGTMLAEHPSLRSVYNYVSHFKYRSGNEIRSGATLSDKLTVSYAKEMYQRGSGNCYRFSSLFACCARALGYNAKVVTGWVPGRLEKRAPHGWVEIVRKGKSYVCDPDMFEYYRNINWYMRPYAQAPLAYGRW